MYILGISAFYHDSAACLINDGVIVAAAEEERFSRKKHDNGFPHAAIAFCLTRARISLSEVSHVVFYEKPFLKFERLLETYVRHAPHGLSSFLTAMPQWLEKKIWMEDVIRRELNWTGSLLFTEHHLSHAASAFFPSPFEDAAVLILDAVGEWATTSWGVGHRNTLTLRQEISFPDSLGLLYSAFTYYCGFKVNSGEYKLMGLAPYGTPRYAEYITKQLIDLKPDGSFRLHPEYFNYETGLTMTSEKFHKLFGGSPRTPEGELTERHMDLAASVQAVTEEVVLRIARHIHTETKQRFLCMAGGVALNCVANGRLLREGPFENVWVQPAAGDSGGALGAALWAWHVHSNQLRQPITPDAMQGGYLGPEYTPEEIKRVLETNRLVFDVLPLEQLLTRVADLLAQAQVVGWFQGRMEFGPRALGNRSILGDARSPAMQSVMNVKIKFRESFRPFAPAVLAERTEDFFDWDRPSPYMLFTAPVAHSQRVVVSPSVSAVHGLGKLKVLRSTVPAITHVDYSARLQTVHSETNPLFQRLLSTLEERHRIPLLINTSFNVRGEPIVCSPEDAIACFLRTHMDYLAIGPFLLAKKAQSPEVLASKGPGPLAYD